MENQALGLAEAVARLIPADVTTKRISLSPPGAWLPYGVWGSGLADPRWFLTARSDSLKRPWPDLLVGCGRIAVAASIAVRRHSKGRTFTVQTQDPRVSPARFDLVVPPEHDRLTGPNVLPIIGAPHRVTSETLAEGRAQFWHVFTRLPCPLVAVLIGGATRVHRLGREEMAGIVGTLRGLADQGVGLAVTTSRRTGPANEALLREGLAGTGAYIWDGKGENPYFGLLALAETILVTADSINMATEAAATGKPVHILPIAGGAEKFRRFHKALESRGIARPFSGTLDTWSYTPLAETERAARFIVDLLDRRGPSTM